MARASRAQIAIQTLSIGPGSGIFTFDDLCAETGEHLRCLLDRGRVSGADSLQGVFAILQGNWHAVQRSPILAALISFSAAAAAAIA